MERYAFYECPFGFLKIGYENGCVTSVKRAERPDADHCPGPVSDLAATQFREYFAGRRKAFDFPTAPKGTPFQRAVWHALAEIPFGETCSYGEIAAAIGNPMASRAVGMACNKNPIWIATPCHRVVGKNGVLIGYAGGLDMKQALLELEQRYI